jgi:hypothetical protein
MRRILCAGWLVFAATAAVGCGDETTTPPPATPPAEEAPAEEVPEAPAPETNDQAQNAKDNLGGTAQSKGQTGKLLYKMVAPKKPQFVPFVNSVVKTKTMIDAVNLFNRVLTFPTDVPLVAKECGRINAFYSPGTHDVSICFEFIEALHNAYAAKLANKTDAEKMARTAEVIAFFTLHEAGHAFLGENKLGTLGGEEDVVDDISGIFFVANKQPQIPVYGTNAIVSLQPTSSTFSDEHSFTRQRYFNMLCLVYGSDPKTYAGLIGPEADNKLPEDRAVRCPSEWTKKTSALKTLIGPYVRK